LVKIDPKSIETNKLGYLLAIKRFDNNVADFDRNLYEAGADLATIYSLQLAYYLAFDSKNNILNCANALVDIELKDSFGLNTLVQAVETASDYKLASQFINNYYKNINHTPHLDRMLKEILVSRLTATLKSLREKK